MDFEILTKAPILKFNMFWYCYFTIYNLKLHIHIILGHFGNVYSGHLSNSGSRKKTRVAVKTIKSKREFKDLFYFISKWINKTKLESKVKISISMLSFRVEDYGKIAWGLSHLNTSGQGGERNFFL